MYKVLSKPLQLLSIGKQETNDRLQQSNCNQRYSGIVLQELTLIEIGKIMENLKKEKEIKVKVISVCGEYKTGKSLLINTAFGLDSGFQISNSAFQSTRGISVLPIYCSSTQSLVILLDCEGFNNPNSLNNFQNDTSVLLFCTLISDLVLYNTRGAIDETQMDNIAVMAAKLKEMQISQSPREQQIGRFVWVLRDWGLQWCQGEHCEDRMASEKYLESLIRSPQYKVIQQILINRNCVSLPRPCISETNLLNFSSMTSKNLPQMRPQFLEQLQTLKNIIEKTLSEPQTQKNQSRNDMRQYLKQKLSQISKIPNSGPIQHWNKSKQISLQELCKTIKQKISHRLSKLSKKVVAFKELEKLDRHIKNLISEVNRFKNQEGEMRTRNKIKELSIFYNNEKEVFHNLNNKRIQHELEDMLANEYGNLQQNILFKQMTHQSEELTLLLQESINSIFQSYSNKYSYYYGQTDLKGSNNNFCQSFIANIVTKLFPRLLNKTQQHCLGYYQTKLHFVERQLIEENKLRLSDQLEKLKKQQCKCIQEQNHHKKIIDRMQECYNTLKHQYQSRQEVISVLSNKLIQEQQQKSSKQNQIVLLKQAHKQLQASLKENIRKFETEFSEETKKREKLQLEHRKTVNKLHNEKEQFLALLKDQSGKQSQITESKINLQKLLLEKEEYIKNKEYENQKMLTIVEKEIKEKFIEVLLAKEQQFEMEKKQYQEQILKMKGHHQVLRSKLGDLEHLLAEKQSEIAKIAQNLKSIQAQDEQLQRQHQSNIQNCIGCIDQLRTRVQILQQQIDEKQEALEREKTRFKEYRAQYDKKLEQYAQKLLINRKQIEDSLDKKYVAVVKELKDNIRTLKQELQEINHIKSNRSKMGIFPIKELKNYCYSGLQRSKIDREQIQSLKSRHRHEIDKLQSQKELLLQKIQRTLQIHEQQKKKFIEEYSQILQTLKSGNDNSANTIDTQRELIGKYEKKVKKIELALKSKDKQLEDLRENIRCLQGQCQNKESKFQEDRFCEMCRDNEALRTENQYLKKTIESQQKRINKTPNLHKIVKQLKKEIINENATSSNQVPSLKDTKSDQSRKDIFKRVLQQKQEELELIHLRLQSITTQFHEQQHANRELIIQHRRQIYDTVQCYEQKMAKAENKAHELQIQHEELQIQHEEALKKMDEMYQDSEYLKKMVDQLKKVYIQEKQKGQNDIKQRVLKERTIKEVNQSKSKHLSSRCYGAAFDDIFRDII